MARANPAAAADGDTALLGTRNESESTTIFATENAWALQGTSTNSRGVYGLSEAEQKQVVDLFREFSVSTYASEFSDFGGERFEIGGEQVHAGVGTIVETRLILTEGSPIALNYLLRQTPAGWRIVDIYLAGTISELARRRDEFASIIRNQGVDGLIALLKRKNQELAGSS